MIMKMKVLACVLTAASLMAAPVFAASESSIVLEDTQNPVMNFIGVYSAERPEILIEAEGSENGKVTVTWGSSYREHSEWEMSGLFDSETKTITYDNCTRKNFVFREDGELESVETVYENGSGTIEFSDTDELSLIWNDDMEDAADELVFRYVHEAAPDDTESVSDVEDLMAGSEYAVSSSVEIENGIMTIYLEKTGEGKDGFFWSFQGDGSTDDEYIIDRITDTDMEEGYEYVGSFRALQDGDTYIRLIHTNGVYTDMYMDFNVKARDGKITENNGGSCVYGVDAREFYEHLLKGEWKDENDESLSLTFSLTDDDGFQAVISDENGEIQNMTVYYDAMYESMICDEGALIPDISPDDPTDAGILWRNDTDDTDTYTIHRFIRADQ